MAPLRRRPVSEQLEGLDLAIFKSSFPIAYRDGLYDTVVNAPVDMNGLVIYDGSQDRFLSG